jgi:hypothetical protein
MLSVIGLPNQTPNSLPSIEATLDRQVACYLEPGDGVFDVHLFFTARYANAGDREEIYFDDEQAGVVWVLDRQAPFEDGLEFMPARPAEPVDRTKRFVVFPGETSARAAHVVLTVRNSQVPREDGWLGPGRHLFRVLVRRMRAATGDERREFSAFGFWREFLSTAVEVEIAEPAPSALCRAMRL